MQVQAHSDRVAVADDERGQFWSLPVVSGGNREQRAAQGDQLFVGDDGSYWPPPVPHWDTADDDYTKAEKLTHTVGDALAIRDRAWAEIPYFAAWLARPLPEGEPSQSEDEEINGTLLHLIRAAHGLDATLASPPTTEATAATESPPFEGEAREVRERLEHAGATLHERVQSAGGDPKNKRRPSAARPSSRVGESRRFHLVKPRAIA